VVSEPVQFCPSGGNGLCYSIAVPTSSANAGSGNIYFQLKAPTSFQWVALGTGSSMAGSNIFLMYQDGKGNLTLSPRTGVAHTEPKFDTSDTAARLTLLAGSGVSSDGETMTANVVCSNCQSWSGGEMSLASTSAGWIGAWKAGSSLATTDQAATITYHDDHAQFKVDLTKASVSSDSNPFTTSRNNEGGGGSGSGSGTGSSGGPGGSGGSGGSSPGGVTPTGGFAKPTMLVAHGAIMGLVFVLLYPLGSIVMPLLGRWWLHAAFQTVAFCLMWAGFALGYVTADKFGFLWTQPHAIFGTVVVALLGLQPFLGFVHHQQFIKTRRRGAVSYIHIWWGRLLMALGVINGGLGLKLAKEENGPVIAYGVGAGVVYLAYIGYKTGVFFRDGTSARHSSKESNGGAQMEHGAPHEVNHEKASLVPSYYLLCGWRLMASSGVLSNHVISQPSARKAVAAVSRLAMRNAVPARTFMAPTVSRRADFVQELYLKELKAYKPAPIKETDSVGQVATFSVPKTPKSPEEADLASSLKEYESMAVEVEGQEGAAAGQAAPVVEDWLVEEEEEEAHH
ncbi:putative carbohydrate binding protein, partial [Chaetomium sp. MPI-SDFR-AT-0129]